MARIRTIKPSFFTSLTVTQLPRDARLTFAGLLTYCDDAGRGVDEPRLIKSTLWPLDDDVTPAVVAQHVDAMEALGLVRRYAVGGRRYLHVAGFAEHQNVNRPQPSKLPAPPAESTKTAADRADAPAAHTAGTVTEGSRATGNADMGSFAEDSLSDPGSLSESSSRERKGKEGKGDTLVASGDATRPLNSDAEVDPPPQDSRPRYEYPPAFEAVWSRYPSRGDSHNSKRAAFAKWRASINRGVTSGEMAAGVERYRAYCDARRQTGSEFVQLASTFFGPGEHWREPWNPSDDGAVRPCDAHDPLAPAALSRLFARHNLDRATDRASYAANVDAACPAGVDPERWRDLVRHHLRPWDLGAITFPPARERAIADRLASALAAEPTVPAAA